MAQSSQPTALYEPPSTPPLRRSRIKRAIMTVYEEDDQASKSADGPEYEPSPDPPRTRKRRPQPLATPYKRRKTSSSLLTTQRRNVDDAVKAHEPNATTVFCVVTKASAEMTILGYAHVLSVGTPDDVLTKLEWVWNQECGTFNVDTRRNVHPLDTVIHRYFDRTDGNAYNGWFWCPVDAVVLEMRDSWQDEVRHNPDSFYDQRKFLYRLVPFPAMKQAWSIRRPADMLSEFKPSTQVQQSCYPFRDLPVISLHVPYHFVICDTGKKLQTFYKDMDPTLHQIEADFYVPHREAVYLKAVMTLYKLWMSSEPSAEWKSAGPSNIGGDPEVQPDSGGTSGHGASGGQGRTDDAGGPPQGSSGQGAGGSGSGGLAPSPLLPPLGPGDSISCRDLAVGDGESGEEMQMDDEEEWEDAEYGEYLQAWVEDVWEATHK
ncbi:hypothetical protein FB107DRAFT_264903, partial [Schizophyllum commune]